MHHIQHFLCQSIARMVRACSFDASRLQVSASIRAYIWALTRPDSVTPIIHASSRGYQELRRFGPP